MTCEKEIYKLNLINENLEWFSQHKNKYKLKKDDQLWFESIIMDNDFKTKIITKFRLKKLKRIL